MSDLLLELYSEEIPPTLQEDAKSNISANFTSFFEVFSKIDFKGPIVMQVYRDDEGVEIFKKQFDWLKLKIKNEYDCNYSS